MLRDAASTIPEERVHRRLACQGNPRGLAGRRRRGVHAHREPDRREDERGPLDHGWQRSTTESTEITEQRIGVGNLLTT
jgi:hypothetical protein